MTDPHVTPEGEPGFEAGAARPPQSDPAPSPEEPVSVGEPGAAGAEPTPEQAADAARTGGGRHAQRPAETEQELEEEFEDDLTRTRRDVAELTSDLQRLQAEFLNYKRRVERDRELIRQNATYAALAPITEVLDTIDRAREHAALDGGFKAVADQLERIVAGLGLAKFGAVGDPFDPTIHEALSHIGQDPDVAVTTCKVIAKAGYRIGDRVVRAAQVLVVDPADGPTEAPAAPAEAPGAPAGNGNDE